MTGFPTSLRLISNDGNFIKKATGEYSKILIKLIERKFLLSGPSEIYSDEEMQLNPFNFVKKIYEKTKNVKYAHELNESF